MSGTSGPSSSLNEIHTFIDRVNIGFAALTMNNDRTVSSARDRPDRRAYESDADDPKPTPLMSCNFCFVFCPTR